MRICLVAALLLSVAGVVGCGSGGASSSGSTGTTGSTGSSTNYAIADEANNRVLIFESPLSTNGNASVVLGQTSFIVNSMPAQITANMFTPAAVAADSAGNLYVTDNNNCRILQFRPPFSNNMNASLAIGAPSLTTTSASACSATANTIGKPEASRDLGPEGMVFDTAGNLWTTDPSNSRVLKFAAPFSNGMSASIVIGQTAMTGSFCNQSAQSASPTASTLCNAGGLAFDFNGDLWVSDSGNSRVLEFMPPFSTGMAASLELGQPADSAFTSSGSNNNAVRPTGSTLDGPAGIVFDASGNLWVADYGNNRVLQYVAPFSNGMAAALEFGQATSTAFTSGSAGVTQSALSGPAGITIDPSGNLLVDDSANNRVMIFDLPFADGMNAAAILGQIFSTSGYANGGRTTPEANTLADPVSIAIF
jgi:sugar lactone lactonase YvrE